MASNVLKSRHGLTINRHRFMKHLLGANSQAVVAVFLAVDNEFFLGFAVPSHAEDGVLPALVVPVSPWLNDGHGRTPPSNRFHSSMTHSSWSGSATASPVFGPVGGAS